MMTEEGLMPADNQQQQPSADDKVYLLGIRFLAIASFATSVFACFSAHHTVTVNEHAYVDHLFEIKCEDLQGDSREYCEQSLLTRYYTLWRSFDNFFSLVDWDSGALCGTRNFPVPVQGDIAMLTVDNLGHCTDTVAIIAAGATILTCIFCAYWIIFIAILQTNYHSGMFILILSAMTGSIIAIATYTTSIDPLRLDPTFCEKQTMFDHCQQETGVGFWFQVATLIMTCLAFFLGLAWNMYGSHNHQQPQEEVPPLKQEEDDHQHPPFYCSLHFYVQLVRFSELAILIIGVVCPFTKVTTTIPESPSSQTQTAAAMINNTSHSNSTTTDLLDHAFAGKGGTMETEINLWQGLFCHPFGARLFLWSVVLNELHIEEETFGECEGRDLFEVQMGYCMAMLTAITAMTFQKDAKSMPLAYMVGFVMHFLSMVKLSWAIGAFMTEVFPGRSEIEPSYCSIWTSYLGPDSSCDISVGTGLLLTGAALATVIVSFIGEVIIQNNEEYGVSTAYRTLMGRVRERRFTDLIKPTSERKLDVDQSDMEDPLETNSVGSKINLNFKEEAYNTTAIVPRDTNVVVVEQEEEPAPKFSMSVLLTVVMALVVVMLVLIMIGLLVLYAMNHGSL